MLRNYHKIGDDNLKVALFLKKQAHIIVIEYD